MATYDTYEVEEPRSHKHRHHKHDRGYVETKETYIRGNPVANTLSPETAYSRDMVRQPMRQDSDLSIEEVRREFPPPAAAAAYQRSLVRDPRYGPPVRARSTDRYADYYYADNRRHSYQDAPRRGRKDTVVEEKRVEERPASLTRNQKLIAAVGGAALAVGGKELWDRRQAASTPDGERAPRNPMATAAVGAAGAFAGYEGAELYAKRMMKQKSKKHAVREDKHGRVSEYYSSDSDEVHAKKSKSRKADRRSSDESIGGKKRSKSKDGKKSKDKDPPEKGAKVQQAAKAALLAGAYEAFRVRNEPGTWNGEKGKRIITAAIGAGGIDAAADRKPSEHSKRHMLESVIGGLAGNRLINGSRKEVVEDEVTGRSTSRARSRSRARSQSRGPDAGKDGSNGLGALAAAGIAGLAGSKLLNRSRSRARGDSDDDSSDDDRRGGSRKRSKSVTDYARKGLAALGLGDAAASSAAGGRGDRYEEETRVYKSRRGGGSERGDPYGDGRYADSRSSIGGRSGRSRRAMEDSDSDTSSLGSSSGDERRIKKMRGKQFLTAGLATVATIHAAHNIYQSMEKRDARHKAVMQGEMTPEEARKLKAKATLQDAASVGIAALGIKGAVSEIKDANELRHECQEFNMKKAERHRKRTERIRGSSANSGYSRRDLIEGPRHAEYRALAYDDGAPYPSSTSDTQYDRR